MMQLSELRIIRLPGLNKPFDLPFKPGINLIIGPNGSGKSSLTRAVFRLLWPGPTGKPWEVSADFQDDGQNWQAETDNGQTVTWLLNGEPSAPPALPAVQISSSYRMGVRDLNPEHHGDDDRGLAQIIRQQMDGGYDLSHTQSELFSIAPRAGHHQKKALAAATTQVREQQNRYQALERRRQGLASLKAQLERAEQAAGRRQLLNHLAQEKEKQSEQENLIHQLEKFSAGISAVTAEDPNQFQTWQDEHKSLTEKLARQTSALAELEQQRESLALTAKEGDAELLAALAQKLSGQEEDQASDQRELAGLKFSLGQEEPESGPVIGQQTYHQLLDLHASRQELEAQEKILQDRAVQLEDASTSPVWPMWVLACAGLGLAALGIWQMLQEPSGPLTLPALLVGFLSLLGGAFLGGRNRANNQAALKGELTRAQEKLNREATANQEQLSQFAREHGLELDNPHLVHDLKALGRQLETQANAEALTGQMEHRQGQMAQTLASINTILEKLEWPAIEQAVQAQQAAQKLAKGLQDAKVLSTKIEGARESRENTAQQVQKNQRDMSALLERLQLSSTASFVDVKALADARPAWEKAKQELAILAKEIQDLHRQIENHRHLLDVEKLQEEPAAQLLERARQEEDLSATENQLREDIVKLETEIKQAQDSHQLEQAQSLQDRAQLELADQRQWMTRASLGQMLMDDVRRQSESKSRPAVLEEAMELLARFTHHRYSLVVSGGGDRPFGFQARDNDSQKTLELDQLSDGTRAQLLLAVRLGFVFRSEGQRRPPLFLDDSLTSSDPQRFAAIVSALSLLARQQNRQIIYLSSNPADGLAWQKSLAELEMSPPHVIDLRQRRQLGHNQQVTEMMDWDENSPALKMEKQAIAPIPSSQGFTAAQYAELIKVPALDPWAGSSATHLFYVLSDQLELLEILLNAGITTVGRWMSAGSRLSETEIIDADSAAMVDQACLIWNLVLEGWQVGRGRPVTMHDVEASGAVSETMRERVLPVLEAAHYDGHAFIHGLKQGQASGLRKDKINQLQKHLELEGFLDSRSAYSAEELVQQVLLAMVPAPANLSAFRSQTLGFASWLDLKT